MKLGWVISVLCVSVGLFTSCSKPTAIPSAGNQLVTQPSPSPEIPATATPIAPFRRIQLLETGDGFHGDEIKARSGQEWLGLYVNTQGSQLIWSKLKIEMVEDAIVDADIPGQKTGKSVFVDRKEEPIFLMRHAPFSQPGKVVTSFSTKPDGYQILYDRQPMKFQLGDLSYELVMLGDAPSEQSDTIPAINPRLILRQGSKEQVVFHLTQGDGDVGWQLRWAGDLDGDGKLDFYADLPEHYNVSRRKLFVSSQAKPGDLVREVGEFVTTGC